MDELLSKMPEALANHLKSLMKLCGFDADPDARTNFIRNWLKKKAFFDKIIEHQGFHPVTAIEPGFREGIILLTYSGSILTLSPEDEDQTREVVYNSIEMRKDVVEKTSEKNARIVFPIRLHESMQATAGKIRKTSPILGMAVEDNPDIEPECTGKRLRIIGERISKTLVIVNQELFSRHGVHSGLEDRADLFDKWVILKWFRTGGWEEAVFYERARMLWFELFSRAFNDLSLTIKEATGRDQAFLKLVNEDFSRFIDDYKWLESERIHRDLGLMKALEELPGRKDFLEFLGAGAGTH